MIAHALRGLAIGPAAMMFCAVPAAAQKLANGFPADKYEIAPGGVDLRTGHYVYSATDLSIGPKDGGLTLNRMKPVYSGNRVNPFANFSHNWDIFLTQRGLLPAEIEGLTEYHMAVHLGGRTLSFRGAASGTGFGFQSNGHVANLTLTSGGTKGSSSAVFTAKTTDGTILVFRPMGGLDCDSQTIYNITRRCAYVSEMTQPDGTKYSFTYAYDSALPNNRARLKQVVSNRGYALLLEGTGSTVTKACVLNLSAMTVPVSGLCPAGVPTTSYLYNAAGKLDKAIGADGAESRFTYAAAGAGLTDMGFIKPGQTAAWLTNRIEMIPDEEWTAQEVTKLQTFADGRTYSYEYGRTPIVENMPEPTIIGGAYTDNLGKTFGYGYAAFPDPVTQQPPNDFQDWVYKMSAGPVEITDQLGRSWTASYCDPVLAASGCTVIQDYTATDPAGGTERVLTDGHGNIAKITKYPKPGSSLAPIVTEAAYGFTNIVTQDKPLWIKDGNGNQTDYTYDPNHGGLLTETGPAVNGVRPQKRYAYAQRYAWLSNGSGGYAQSAAPVWLLVSESFCRTSAASGAGCSVAGDEVVTAFDYGPNSGPNNLWLRGTTVTADGVTRRSCIRYDSLGRKISETSPNANLTSCP